MSFESIFKTDTVESHATHLKEGFLMGWIPGIITDLRDPEMIGRVKVRCDLLAENVDLPNENDGWVWVTEEFCLANRPGGTHRMLEVGTQVAMIPMMGDARQMLIIGCLPSRVDRPPEGADRAEKRYGKQTPGGVIEMNDDKKAAKITSFPHGVLQGVTGTGDIIYETRDKARFSLTQDGNSLLGNDLASMQTGKNGDVSLFSGGSATANFSADGQIAIASPNNSVLSLDGNTALVTGPNPQVSQRLNRLKGLLLGCFYFAAQDLKIIDTITDDFTNGRIQPLVFLEKSRQALKRLHQGIADNLSQSTKDFDELKEHSAVDFAKCCEGQIKEALRLGLGELIKVVKGAEGKSGDEIVDYIKNEIPDKFLDGLDLGNRIEVFRRLSDIKPTLNALKYNPEFQTQLIIATLLPQGWSSVEILFGLGIADKIEELEEVINPKEKLTQLATVMTPADEKKWWEDLSDRINGVKGLLDSKLVEFISDQIEDFNVFDWAEQDKLSESGISIPYSSSLLKSVPLEEEQEKPDWYTLNDKLVPGESPLAMLLGTIFKGMMDKISDRLTQLKDQQEILDKIDELHVIAETLVFDESNTAKILFFVDKLGEEISAKDDVIQATTFKLLPRLYKELVEKILPLLEETWIDTNTLINWIPDNPQGGILQAKDDQVQLQSNVGSNGAIVKIDRTSATLSGPEFGDSMRTRIFADKSDAGMQSGDKGGAVRVERRVSEILGPERKSDEKRDSYLEGENKYKIDASGRAIAKGAVQKEPKYLKQKEKTPTVRSSMAVDSDGNAMIRSGGNGSSFTVGEQKAEIKGPEVEIDGKKTRTEFFALAGEIGMAAGGVGGTVWMGQEQSEVLSPEIEVNGKKVRRTVSADPKEAKLWSGTEDGTTVSSDDEKALVLGPKGKGSITVDSDKVKMLRPDGQVSMELTDVLAQVLGPKAKGILSFTEDVVEMIGRDDISLLRLAEGLAEFVGPDGKKAVQMTQQLLKVLDGKGSILEMAEEGFNLLGFGKEFRMAEKALKILGGGGSIMEMAEESLNLLGFGQEFKMAKNLMKIIGGGGSVLQMAEQGLELLGFGQQLKMAKGILEIFGSGGGMKIAQGAMQLISGSSSLNITPNGIFSKGLGGGLSIGGNGASISGTGKTVMRNGSSDGETGIAIILDAEGGFATLSSFFAGEWNIPNEDDDILQKPNTEHQSARIGVKGNAAFIEALGEDGEAVNSLEVSDRGILFNDKRLGELLDLIDLIPDILARIESLESSSGNSSGGEE